jgi:hypothetical protein
MSPTEAGHDRPASQAAPPGRLTVNHGFPSGPFRDAAILARPCHSAKDRSVPTQRVTSRPSPRFQAAKHGRREHPALHVLDDTRLPPSQPHPTHFKSRSRVQPVASHTPPPTGSEESRPNSTPRISSRVPPSSRWRRTPRRLPDQRHHAQTQPHAFQVASHVQPVASHTRPPTGSESSRPNPTPHFSCRVTASSLSHRTPGRPPNREIMPEPNPTFFKSRHSVQPVASHTRPPAKSCPNRTPHFSSRVPAFSLTHHASTRLVPAGMTDVTPNP